MKEIRLLGDLQAFKSEWSLDVSSVAEALRAINANRPGFLHAADAGDYVLLLMDRENPDLCRQVTADNALYPWADEVLFVVPRVGGDEPFSATAIMGASIAVTGTIVMSAGVAAMMATALNLLVSIALSMAVSMVASLISGTNDGMKASEAEPYENKPSYLFNGVVNTTRQGHRMPLLYGGPLLVGSMVLSSQIHVKDIPA
jgi:predicted phage tail protein